MSNQKIGPVFTDQHRSRALFLQRKSIQRSTTQCKKGKYRRVGVNGADQEDEGVAGNFQQHKSSFLKFKSATCKRSQDELDVSKKLKGVIQLMQAPSR